MKRCLYCYQLLGADEIDFHPTCSKYIFGKPQPPVLDFNESQMEEMAKKIIRSHSAVTGVQAKLSLTISKGETTNDPDRFTIVGLWGGYILKPPTINYQQLPEVEDLTMHLAALAGIKTVPHSLIRLSSGNLAYITKRIDRNKKQKIHMEDMCQITERLTEDKYHGSYEQIAKAILKYSANPGLDVVNFYEQVLFSYLTGNADMHLKNFSLINTPGIGYTLAPAYDMVATALVNPTDNEELALTLNGRKRKITRNDFVAAFTAAKIDVKAQDNIFKKFEKSISKWMEFIDTSFLNKKMKDQFRELIRQKIELLRN
jgi:serine/threonine-protein kinase HipA